MIRELMQLLAFALLAVTLLAWLSLGPNLGWTKTSVTKWSYDPVTELEGPVIEKRFIPGIDFVGASLLVSAALFGLSFLRKQKASTP